MPTDAALTGSGIVKRFGKRLVLDGAALELRPGEVVALVGEDGAGKTSLLRICAGLLNADAGTIERHGRIGYCPQQPALFDHLTAREHLILFGRAVGLDRASAVRQGDEILAGFGFRGANTTIAKAMSGGSRQKLNLVNLGPRCRISRMGDLTGLLAGFALGVLVSRLALGIRYLLIADTARANSER